MADDERQDRAMKCTKRRKEENLKSSLVSFFFVFARFVGLLPM